MSAIALTRQNPRAGDFVAKMGAWDRRYYIHYIRRIRTDEQESKYSECFVVGLEAVGHFYANGKVIRPKRRNKIREMLLHGPRPRYDAYGLNEPEVYNHQYRVVYDPNHPSEKELVNV